MLILGNPDSGDTRLLKIALQDGVEDSRSTISVHRPEEFSLSQVPSEKTPIFLVLDGSALFESDTGRLADHKPSNAIQVAWMLMKASRPIYIAVPTDCLNKRTFSPTDALALCVSGVSGFWEIAPSLLNRSGDQAIPFSSLEQFWRQKRVFLYGHNLIRDFFGFYERVAAGDWPTTIETSNGKGRNWDEELSESQRKACFSLALAIAALDESDLRVRNETGKMNLDSVAMALQQISNRTGIFVGKTVLPKYLGYLDRGWKVRLSAHYDKSSRHKMPLWAQMEGFASAFPLIRDVPYTDVAEQLYYALDGLDFERGEPTPNTLFTTINISKNAVKATEK